mmetsp:Transcript_11330/g.28507  ORF Transcript_11330/g.28507 Transcript_11330/m.28507 type:complete len:276 (+) Transcript_11330:171-998(+)
MFRCCQQGAKRRRKKSVEEIDVTSSSDENSDSDDEGEWCYDDHEWDSMYFGGLCCPTEPAAQPPGSSLRSKTIRMSASFSSEFDLMPPAERGDPKSLVLDSVAAPELSLDGVREVVEEREVLESYLKEFSGAYDIEFTDWFNVPGGLRACRAKFHMPVPQEVPAALARLVSVPETSAATMVVAHRECGDDEELVMLQQVTHDVPFGENFRVQEAVSFRRAAAGGGVVCSKWTTVKWIKDLPWHVSMIRPITESKTMAKSPEGGQAFLKAVRSSAK